MIRGRATVSAAVYYNNTKDEVYFTQVASYTSAAPPPGWPLPPQVLDQLIANNAFGPGQGLPSTFSYRNLGRVKDKGVELGTDLLITREVTAFANYAWQAQPVPDFDISEINLPSRHRFNVGVTANVSRYFGTMSVSYASSAYWQDVLDARYHGPTKAYTLVNAGVGVKWKGDKFVTSLKVTNLGNQAVQQHVFGDVIKRRVVGEVQFGF
jgi:outer membrane receptor for ferrienterochelin and colicin